MAILGHALWQARFGGEARVIGRPVELDGVPHEVVGVMPPGFALPTDFTEDAAEPTQIYVPARSRRGRPHAVRQPRRLRGRALARGPRWTRPRPSRCPRGGVGATGRASTPVPMAFPGPSPSGVRGERDHWQPSRPALMALLAAATLVLLLITCSNVAGLLLARAEARQREMAVRASLGGGGARLVGQLLVEGLLLALAGRAVGLGSRPRRLAARAMSRPTGCAPLWRGPTHAPGLGSRPGPCDDPALHPRPGALALSFELRRRRGAEGAPPQPRAAARRVCAPVAGGGRGRAVGSRPCSPWGPGCCCAAVSTP